MEKKEYLKLVKKITPKENNFKDYINAFLMGGTIGFISELIKLILVNCCNLTIENATSYILLILIFLSCLLTSLGSFDNIVSKFKCGIIIPITGFAHSIMASALDYKKDGLITGLGSNFFKLAGSVILYATISGFLMGIVKVILNV